MDGKEIITFCDRWIKLFSAHKEDEDFLCEDNLWHEFDDFMKNNGAEIDCLKSWFEKFPDYEPSIQKAEEENEADFIKPLAQIDDVHFLLTAIYSEWRHVTHSDADYYYRWFIAALKRLAELAGK